MQPQMLLTRSLSRHSLPSAQQRNGGLQTRVESPEDMNNTAGTGLTVLRNRNLQGGKT